jgi:hypothetical protein
MSGFRRPVRELCGQEDALHRSQEATADDHRQRKEDRKEHPYGRAIGDLSEQGGEGDNEAADQDHEDSRTIAGICPGQV